MQQTFYGNGKLLLTGEYAVLDGALSLAIPTKYGQTLEVDSIDPQFLRWTSFDENNKIWFQQNFYLHSLQPMEDSEVSEQSREVSERLSALLEKARKLNPQFLASGQGYEAKSYTNFNRNWGLGTSSTLVHNIAQWAEINPFSLNSETFGGSGYDIACASHDHPILYQVRNEKPSVTEIAFDHPFKQQLWFVYLNRKQDSREAILRYKELAKGKPELIERISDITQQVTTCTELSQFQSLILEHERLLAAVLDISTVQETLFPEYKGVVKSLGAWGGDFVLAAGDQEDPDYFISKGYATVIPFEEMIK